MNKKNKYKDQCDNCPHNIQTHGACDLQDFNYCVSVCKTWADVYKHCPLKKENED